MGKPLGCFHAVSLHGDKLVMTRRTQTFRHRSSERGQGRQLSARHSRWRRQMVLRGCDVHSYHQSRTASRGLVMTPSRMLRTFPQASACFKGESEPATIIISFLETIDSCCREVVKQWLKQGILYSAQERTCERLDPDNALC